jgi:hypothetical protein
VKTVAVPAFLLKLASAAALALGASAALAQTRWDEVLVHPHS